MDSWVLDDVPGFGFNRRFESYASSWVAVAHVWKDLWVLAVVLGFEMVRLFFA